MTMMTKVLGVVIAAMLAAPVNAMTGNEWVRQCSKTERDPLKRAVEYGGCLGYVNGLRAGLDMLQGFRGFMRRVTVEDEVACIPLSVDTGQLVDVGQRFMKSHPEQRHETAATFLFMAFREAWPCKGVPMIRAPK